MVEAIITLRGHFEKRDLNISLKTVVLAALIPAVALGMSLKTGEPVALIAAGAMSAAPASATGILFSGFSSGTGALDNSFSGVFDGVWNGSAYVLDADISGIQTQGTNSGTQTQGANSRPITALSPYADADNPLFGPNSDLMPDFGGVSGSTGGGDFNWFPNGGDFELGATTDTVGYPQNGLSLLGSSYATVAGVPEPATWAMFLVGFSAIGWTLRGSRRKGAITTA